MWRETSPHTAVVHSFSSHRPLDHTEHAIKKLKLTLADLEVSSFIAQNKNGQPGTVNGMQQYTGFTVCYFTYGDCQHSLYLQQHSRRAQQHVLRGLHDQPERRLLIQRLWRM